MSLADTTVTIDRCRPTVITFVGQDDDANSATLGDGVNAWWKLYETFRQWNHGWL